MAASIAYRTVFALAPLLILAVAIAGHLVTNIDVRNQVLSQIQPVLGSDVTDVVSRLMDNASQARNASTVLGTALLLWTGSSLFLEVQGALNTIFHIPEDRRSGVWATIRKRLVAMAASVLLGVLMGAVVVMNGAVSFIGDIPFFQDLPAWSVVVSLLGPALSFVLLIGVFGLLFQGMTAARIPWRGAWRGAFFTSLLFVAGAAGLGFFFSIQTGGFSATGFATGFVLILFLVFFLAQIFLFGAEVTKTYLDYQEHGDIVKPSVREEREEDERFDRLAAMSPERRRLRQTGVLADVGFWAFVSGFVLGWWRRRP
jgi:membrane protein